MRFTDMMRICYSDLTNKKARTLLTVLGVLVGTCAIIVMISIGIAMEKSQTEMLASMGNLKQIKVHNYNSGRQKAITDQKLKTSCIQLKEKLAGMTNTDYMAIDFTVYDEELG